MKLGKINCISIVKNAYALPLTVIPSPLTSLYCIGAIPQLRRPTVAIIGSRKPTAYGKEITTAFAHALAKKGVVIVSGLAYGVDSIAHQAALDAGGTTIAVLANGLHTVYPAAHTNLAQRIIRQGGAVISERPAGYEVRRHDFLARNRIVSGLADAILIPEATIRSGTLSTVQHALEQGKEVFAIPGPITSELSGGSNQLLQQGAQVALTPEDILAQIAPELLATEPSHAHQIRFPLGETPQEEAILTLMRQGVSARDELAEKSGSTIEEFLQTMTLLELKGFIRPLGGDTWGVRPQT